jgi:CheY-like chemotaxis protein
MSGAAAPAPLVLIADDNLFLRPGIERSLRDAGFAVEAVGGPAALEQALVRGPALVLVNLAGREGLGCVRRVRARAGDALPVVGYGPHVDADLLRTGRETGCTRVVANGKVAADAASVVRQHVQP